MIYDQTLSPTGEIARAANVRISRANLACFLPLFFPLFDPYFPIFILSPVEKTSTNCSVFRGLFSPPNLCVFVRVLVDCTPGPTWTRCRDNGASPSYLSCNTHVFYVKTLCFSGPKKTRGSAG